MTTAGLPPNDVIMLGNAEVRVDLDEVQTLVPFHGSAAGAFQRSPFPVETNVVALVCYGSVSVVTRLQHFFVELTHGTSECFL